MANYLSWQLYSSLFRPPGYHVLILVQTTWLSCTLLCSDPLSTMYSSLFRPQVFHLLVFCICTDHLVIHNVLVFVQTPTCLTRTRLCFEHVVNIVFVLTTRLPSSLFRPRGLQLCWCWTNGGWRLGGTAASAASATASPLSRGRSSLCWRGELLQSSLLKKITITS